MGDPKKVELPAAPSYPELSLAGGLDTVFFAKEPTYSLKCQALLLVYEYAIAICIFTSVMGYCGWKLRQCFWNRRAAKLAGDLYRDVKADLQSSGPSFSGLSRNDIMRKFLSAPRINDKLQRDEKTFLSTVWPMIEQARKADKKVIEVEKVQFGRSVSLWQMK